MIKQGLEKTMQITGISKFIKSNNQRKKSLK